MPTVPEIITESILKQLEQGVAPWRKPWSTSVPRNLISKKPYRGRDKKFWGSLQGRVLDATWPVVQGGSSLSVSRLWAPVPASRPAQSLILIESSFAAILLDAGQTWQKPHFYGMRNLLKMRPCGSSRSAGQNQMFFRAARPQAFDNPRQRRHRK
jgi:hypothetical protein